MMDKGRSDAAIMSELTALREVLRRAREVLRGEAGGSTRLSAAIVQYDTVVERPYFTFNGFDQSDWVNLHIALEKRYGVDNPARLAELVELDKPTEIKPFCSPARGPANMPMEDCGTAGVVEIDDSPIPEEMRLIGQINEACDALVASPSRAPFVLPYQRTVPAFVQDSGQQWSMVGRYRVTVQKN